MKHKVNVKGVIISDDEKWIYDLFEMDATSPKDISKSLEDAKGADLEVIINSGGGSVQAGSEIYTTLKDYPGNVESKIVGLAASAASVIAMAGKVKMSPTAQMMIHNASSRNQGDYRSMDKASEMLKVVNKTIANAYRIKSGMSEEELLTLMDNETWLTPQDALDKGLIDEIMFEDTQIKLSANVGIENMIPQKVIDGIRNGLLKNNQTTAGLDSNQIMKQAFDEFKNDFTATVQELIKNELKPKEPTPKPVQPKQNLSKLFLNLGGK
ncbi:head maturation protease, ClpP-related [Neobacillus massiliamazoniensis]|uniref:ATP-dependent Clp protease proteolytic subunit n=1 Tax=Neobacillus massiliamazoniensis TaxID=1499688 RepID=A0A0U1NRE6_9BACI|nr:head maturation protease, ClpP-related [Neobacillus massiliamazoniensis]CRK80312.1 phage protein [Neobacillus massiliamazoniensis]